MNNAVSNVFGGASAFIVFDVEEKRTKKLKVLENPDISYKHEPNHLL